MEEGRAGEEDECDDRHEHHDGATHDRRRDRVPPPAARRIGLEDGDTQAFDISAQDREQGGEEGEAVENGARDHDRARDAHG